MSGLGGDSEDTLRWVEKGRSEGMERDRDRGRVKIQLLQGQPCVLVTSRATPLCPCCPKDIIATYTARSVSHHL